MSPTVRIRVVCSTACGWASRRAEAGGTCPQCGRGEVIAAPTRAPSSEEGPRVRVVAHVAPETQRKLEERVEETGAVGVGTVLGQLADAWARGELVERKRKRKRSPT
jgi:hypothetical protein